MPEQAQPSNLAPQGPALGADAALSALRALAGPLAKLAVQAGLNHAQVDEIWRMAMVDEAAKNTGAGMGNVSRVSVATGLHRKEVMRLQDALAQVAAGTEQTPKKRPWASQLVLLWADWVSREPYLAVLPVSVDDAREDSAKPSFAKLSRRVTTDVHPRAVLQELLRLGLVSEANGQVSLLSPHFVPKGSADDALGLLADNLQDHLKTGLRNIEADLAALQQPGSTALKWVEQAIWAEGISEQDAQNLNNTAREAWANAYRALYKQMLETPEAPTGQTRQRVRVGLYVSAEAMPEPMPEPVLQKRKKPEKAKASAPNPNSKRKTRNSP